MRVCVCELVCKYRRVWLCLQSKLKCSGVCILYNILWLFSCASFIFICGCAIYLFNLRNTWRGGEKICSLFSLLGNLGSTSCFAIFFFRACMKKGKKKPRFPKKKFVIAFLSSSSASSSSASFHLFFRKWKKWLVIISLGRKVRNNVYTKMIFCERRNFLYKVLYVNANFCLRIFIFFFFFFVS